ncbi:MAG: hypothetical protein DMF84_14180 [Acidobacteria bacterium]|nr:MAG: hypothetical protein DMF84_14180 [Acidobacteriota bacterium]
MTGGGRDVTSLFARIRHGDAEAVNGVTGASYAELRFLAARHIGGEARRHAFRAAALLNATYPRLVQQTVRCDCVFAPSWLKERLQPSLRA